VGRWGGPSGSVLELLAGDVVGREREAELLVAALDAGAHVVLEGPPGTGKSTLLRAVAVATQAPFAFVEGNAELTPARLVGHFDPSLLLAEGYQPSVFVDGPLVEAMRSGGLLYIEEVNRIPEETLNVLLTVMSERELTVPRLGRIAAAAGFLLVAAMNPYDTIGTARISSAVYDRMCRITMGYQDAVAELAVLDRWRGGADATWAALVVELVRRTRSHEAVRVGSSVRGAIDMVGLSSSIAALRGVPATDWTVGLDAALVALSGRMQLHDAVGGDPEGIIRELYADVFGPPDGRPDDARDDREEPQPPSQGDAPQRGPTPEPGRLRPRDGEQRTLEGADVQDALDDDPRRTTSRRELERHELCATVAPEVGELDEEALGGALADDADGALAFLADAVVATDEELRRRARLLAARVVLDRAKTAVLDPRGVRRLHAVPADRVGAELDVDASIDAVVAARAGRVAPALDDLVGRAWGRASIAICLVVDRSGSMAGPRVATAALVAAACAWRAPEDHAVLAFSRDVLVLQGLRRGHRSSEKVVLDLLGLRGTGRTGVAHALEAAEAQLARTSASRKLTVLLSDCDWNIGGDPLDAARRLDELLIVAPAGASAARELGRRCGAATVLADRPAAALDAICDALWRESGYRQQDTA
jgi:MoxR-like ATPase/Mg-chelatase subunit ChlD